MSRMAVGDGDLVRTDYVGAEFGRVHRVCLIVLLSVVAFVLVCNSFIRDAWKTAAHHDAS